ncbi:MAG: hypothetical protein M1825_005222 [Sarcosagium campestre]|nr:MAG: hypothetical protein M1825_005222 [Sarcosagium campestre]
MDLSSIINPDASAESNHSSSSSPKQAAHGTHPYGSSAKEHQRSYQGRPVPPPIQPPSQTEYRSPGSASAFQSGQSPLRYSPPSSGFNGSQYPFPQHPHAQSPGQGPYQRSYVPQESQSSRPSSGNAAQTSYRRSSPSSFTPTALTPGSAHPSYQLPPSQSSTPTSAHSQTPHHYSYSPGAGAPMVYPPHYQGHQSQPGTPLGPPSNPSRAFMGPQRELASPYEPHRPYPGDHYGPVPHNPTSSPSPSAPGLAVDRPVSSSGRVPENNGSARSERDYTPNDYRERSISVSPKTRLPPTLRSATSDSTYEDAPPSPGKRKLEEAGSRPAIETPLHQPNGPVQSFSPSNEGSFPYEDAPHSHHPATGPRVLYKKSQFPREANEQRKPESPNGTDSRTNHKNGLTNPEDTRVRGQSNAPQQHSSPEQTHAQKPFAHATREGSWDKRENQAKTSATTKPDVTALKLDSVKSTPESNGGATSPQQPPRKRARHDEPPIFARKRSTSNSPVVANKRQPVLHGVTGSVHHRHEVKDSKQAIRATADTDPAREANGVAPTPANNGVTLPQAQPVLATAGPLGPWEPSITNVIPHEELTNQIMDFLFYEVVDRQDVSAGGSGKNPGQGTQLEIEAKLGQLIDKNTNERLRLPVRSECVLSKDDPSLRYFFKSSMTESQHRHLNQFLNKTLIASKQPPPPPPTENAKPLKSRISMDYVHTRERDRFYDVQHSQLPQIPLSIRPHLNTRHKMKVRATTDQKTGQPLAQIVKIRLADLDVYSPRTVFDWRLSINLEMAYDGDVGDLVEVLEGGKRSERNKDRMTYRHLAYQIDLTQVTMQSDSSTKPEKEHELEVEVSAAAIREQGLRAKTKQITQYEELVRGFVDNVRTLARVIPPQF